MRCLALGHVLWNLLGIVEVMAADAGWKVASQSAHPPALSVAASPTPARKGTDAEDLDSIISDDSLSVSTALITSEDWPDRHRLQMPQVNDGDVMVAHSPWYIYGSSKFSGAGVVRVEADAPDYAKFVDHECMKVSPGKEEGREALLRHEHDYHCHQLLLYRAPLHQLLQSRPLLVALLHARYNPELRSPIGSIRDTKQRASATAAPATVIVMPSPISQGDRARDARATASSERLSDKEENMNSHMNKDSEPSNISASPLDATGEE